MIKLAQVSFAKPVMNRFLMFQTGIIVFFLLVAAGAFAQNKPNNLNDLFSRLAENQQFNGNVLVAEDGKIIFEKSFGYADFENKKLLNQHFIFDGVFDKRVIAFNIKLSGNICAMIFDGAKADEKLVGDFAAGFVFGDH